MYLMEALECIGEPERIASFPWELRLKEFQERPDDILLTAEAIRARALDCSFSGDVIDRMLEIVPVLEANPALVLIGKCIFRSVFLNSAVEMCGPYPSLKKILPGKDGLFYLILTLGSVPLIRKWHLSAGIPEAVTKHTLANMASVSGNHACFEGTPGIYYPGQFQWMRQYADPGKYYLHIGRFGFMTGTFHFPELVYRRGKEEFTVFMQENHSFDRHGFALMPEDPETDFVTGPPEIRKDRVRGHRVRPDGGAEKNVSELDLAGGWELFLKPGDPILDMHIPAGGGMTPSVVDATFRDAFAFYSAFYDFKAVTCNSWIFNPNLPEILPPESNLNLLLKRVHLLPVHSPANGGLSFLFGPRYSDLNTAPRNTGLQRAVAEYILSGHRWRCGGMFFPRS